LHCLPLLAQRPGVFEHAVPMRRWRKTWPSVYESILEALVHRGPDGREFLEMLKLHRQYSPQLVQEAMARALALGAISLDGVRLCLKARLPGHWTWRAGPSWWASGSTPWMWGSMTVFWRRSRDGNGTALAVLPAPVASSSFPQELPPGKRP